MHSECHPGCAPRDGEQTGNRIVEQSIEYGTVDESLSMGCGSDVVLIREGNPNMLLPVRSTKYLRTS